MLAGANNLSSVKISGHAGFMQKQGDPLCAAVTVLVRTIGRYLQQEGLLVEVKIDAGSLELELVDSINECNRIAYSILKLGLNDLMTEWPNHVKLIEKEL